VEKLSKKVTAAGVLVALGIIFGDIGTSPLYVYRAIIDGKILTDQLVIGGMSCIIWTLTLQTTVKYVILTLQADNNGEGGIFSLYALIRRHAKWPVIFAMIGGAALLADGIITPPITVTSAIEGLGKDQFTTISIVLCILAFIFFMQRFGTASIGRLFGPVMLVWFSTIAFLGTIHLADNLDILKAFNPYYAVNLLFEHPKGFLILGAVFLCTTGAEALYSDLGHCGKQNIRVSWIFVKICLLLNYFGQGAWLLNHNGTVIPTDINPFYAIMPEAFIPFGVVIATCAAIIASQALISGSFTLISEAMRLNLWPKLKINYPSEERGQLFIPGINTLLFIGCTIVVLIFQKSAKMEAAYGLSITLCMIMTSCLFGFYLHVHRVNNFLVALYMIVFLTLEVTFLLANLEKFFNHHGFSDGGYIIIIIGLALFFVMFAWFKSRRIKNRFVRFVPLADYFGKLYELSNDKSIPKYATHLVYMSSANNPKEIEHKIIYSIFNIKPKRADLYWFVHVDVVDEPYKSEYSVDILIPNEVIRVEFRLGFRTEQRINAMFVEVAKELVKNKEVDIVSRYDSLHKNNVLGDFEFVVIEKFLSSDNKLAFFDRIIMQFRFWLKKISLSEEKGFGLDPSHVTVEKYPLNIGKPAELKLNRVFTPSNPDNSL
jgi:KUP system potassium uptake protein